ncbi:tyrosine-type recombinase/integrase [Paenibacillus harenae]|uniref:tyrosine-type recombinase/integrase n=1 Tax=Paenibacillus harenae TaxID=306543 RepID=UPI0027D83F59|nr:tyrosine-type recombinase/integrase [Paenibacillus harenae]
MENVIHLKISCQTLREKALLEFLYSTGSRIGEVEKINIEDLNGENCSAIVNGKGSKQREVYFTAECKVWLKKYLACRDGCNGYKSCKTNGHTKRSTFRFHSRHAGLAMKKHRLHR